MRPVPGDLRRCRGWSADRVSVARENQMGVSASCGVAYRYHGVARVGRGVVPVKSDARDRGRATRSRGDGRAGYATLRRMRATTADGAQSASSIYLICAAAWALPGAGHFWLGRRQKGLTFLLALTLMFAFGLWLQGRLFPFEFSQPLVGLAAVADIGIGIPYFLATAVGAGRGEVTAITYEYGNAFVIVAGLLNMLVVLDAFDVAQGRK